MSKQNPNRNEWKKLFEIQLCADFYEDRITIGQRIAEFIGFDIPKSDEFWHYKLINLHTQEVVGRYKDRHYAIKQARYKYKKITQKIEKSLLT